MRELLDYRSEFPILEHTTYLINHSLGAMPAKAEERVVEYARTWRERGIRAWGEGWWDLPLTVGDQIGRIVGAPAGSTVMHQNVAIAEAVVLSCFQPTPERNRVVYERGNFPSVRYLYQAQRDLEVVVCEDDDEIVESIDERTLLVPISHVLFKSAEIQDVERIVQRAHEVGAYVILDAYQSAGIVPLDVTALNVDFAVGGSVKWLCGGPGNGWLYVRPDLAERLEPAYTGWQAHEAPVRLRGGDALRRRRRTLPDRHAERPGAVRGDSRLRPDRGDRRRADPRQLAPPDGPADPTGGGSRLRDREPPGTRAPRRHRHRARGRVPGRPQGALGAADPLRLPAGRRDPDRAALLHLRRGARARDRADRRDRRDAARTNGTSARSHAIRLR